MKKTLLIIAILTFGLSLYAQTPYTTIMKIDSVVIEEFKSTDEAGTSITSYRRLTKKEARDYIEKIKLVNDYKKDQLEMTNMEIEMLTERLKISREEKNRIQLEMDDNRRRIEEYRNIINR